MAPPPLVQYPVRYTNVSATARQRAKKYMSVYRRLPMNQPRTTQRRSYLNRRGVASRETGYVDLASQVFNGNTTGTIALAATIPQGAAVTQRVGKKVLYKGIQIRGYAQSDNTTTVTGGTWILVYDKRPTGAMPNITDILDTVSTNSFLNDANSGRFKILARRNYSLTGNVLTAGQQNDSTFQVIDEYVKLKNLQGVFKAAGTGAIGDIEEGALYLFTVGTTPTGTSDMIFQLGCRTRFLDV